MEIKLPFKRSEINNNWTDQKIGMIGQSGIGKSEFFSFCNGLYLQTEAGLNYLSVMKVPVNSWEDLRAVYTQLVALKASKEPFPYDTIIIDTIDNLVDMAYTEVMRQQEPHYKDPLFHIGDLGMGKGYSLGSGLVMNFLKKLEEFPCAIVFIGHLDSKEVSLPNNVKITKQTIALGNSVGAPLVAWCDHFLNIESNIVGTSIQRKVRTLPSRTIDAKSRGGIVPDGLLWGDNTEENWKKFRGLFK